MAIERFSQASILTLTKYSSMMAGEKLADYELISTSVLSSAVTSVSFSNLGTLAAAYKHLQIRVVALHSAYQNGRMRINGDTGTNYSWHQLVGNGSAASSYGVSSVDWMQIGYGPNSTTIPTVSIIDILDFKSNKNKTIRTLTGCAYSGTWNVKLMSGSWMSSAAVTSLELAEVLGSYKTGSRFSLYGLRG